jgi:hypothetical protein
MPASIESLGQPRWMQPAFGSGNPIRYQFFKHIEFA